MADEARVVGIAGTAKNTGKTTALNALVAEAHARGAGVAATSIGYDGEAVDNVTGLPKPRIVLHPGALATTARSCVPPRGWEVLAGTGAWTALGEVLLVRCLEAGPIVLAGPNRRSELARVVARMQELGPAVTLVDGALNRLAPMSVASCFVLATGAARTPDPAALVRETAAMEGFFRLAAFQGGRVARVEVGAPFPSLDELAETVEGAGADPVALDFTLPVSPEVLSAAASDPRLRGRISSLVFADPVLPLLCGAPTALATALGRCRAGGMETALARPLPLAAVTVNPFLPRLEGQGFVADAVPADALRGALAQALRSPVVDVVAQGPGPLWAAVAGR